MEVQLPYLALAKMYTSVTAIISIEQSATWFRESIFMKFKMFAPADATDKACGGRASNSVRSTFHEVATDIQKFCNALRLIHSCNLTGVTEYKILSMAIAKHLGKRDGLSYDKR